MARATNIEIVKSTRKQTGAKADTLSGSKLEASQAAMFEQTVSGRELLEKGVNPGTLPTTLSAVDMAGLSDQERKALITEIRREYQRQYYQKHKEKAKEYQRQYNLTHKKKARGGRGKANFECPRETYRVTFNAADLMHSPVEKTVRMLEKIINRERLFTI